MDAHHHDPDRTRRGVFYAVVVLLVAWVAYTVVDWLAASAALAIVH
jgi:hypothetical protein